MMMITNDIDNEDDWIRAELLANSFLPNKFSGADLSCE